MTRSELAGATVLMWYAAVSPAEQRRRHDLRLLADPHSSWPMSDEELRTWAGLFEPPSPGELDGTEPIDPPPGGFTSWPQWMQHRWPPTVTVGSPLPG